MSQPSAWLLDAYLALAKHLNPVWRWALRKRLTTGKETTQSVDQKLMIKPPLRETGPVVWGHAVGVGESLALAGLFARLSQALPDHRFLITSTAQSATQAILANGLGPSCHHQSAPADTPQIVDAFLDYWQPVAAIWCEMDLWPALIAGTARRGIPRALVNARLSPASFAQRRWLTALYRPLLQSFDVVYAQNIFSKQSLIELGAKPTQCFEAGSIKVLGQALGVDTAQLAHWQAVIRNRPVWVFASSHEGEEPLAFAVHQILLKSHPAALLIIAPRYPKRGNSISVASHLYGFATQQRTKSNSLDQSPLDQATQIYIANTIGEMGLWYRLSRAVMMGGSYCAVEGHNPYEPIVLGAQVIYGPHTANFSESYHDLTAQGLALAQTDTAQIAQTIETIWSSDQAAAMHQPTGQMTQPTQATTLKPAMQSMLDTLTRIIMESTANRNKSALSKTHDNTRSSI